jgi:hypothetical protein
MGIQKDTCCFGRNHVFEYFYKDYYGECGPLQENKLTSLDPYNRSFHNQ